MLPFVSLVLNYNPPQGKLQTAWNLQTELQRLKLLSLVFDYNEETGIVCGVIFMYVASIKLRWYI